MKRIITPLAITLLTIAGTLAALAAGAGAAVARDPAGCGQSCVLETAIRRNDVGEVGPLIELALISRGWRVFGRSPGVIDASIDRRNHRADIRITYDERAYRIAYRNSENLSAGGYSRWIANLELSIQARLNAPTAPPARAAGAVGCTVVAVLSVAPGGRMFREERQEPLPNLIGRPDILGRKRTVGFVELYYMGIAQDGRAVFRLRDTQILTNENTMNRSGIGTTIVTAQPYGNGVVVSGVGVRPPPPAIVPLPPDVMELAVDLKQEGPHLIDLAGSGRRVQIIEATADRVAFTVC